MNVKRKLLAVSVKQLGTIVVEAGESVKEMGLYPCRKYLFYKFCYNR